MYDSVYYDRKGSRIYWAEYDDKNHRTEKSMKWVPDFYIELNAAKTTEELEFPDDEIIENPSEFFSQSGKPLKQILSRTFNKRQKKIKEWKACNLPIFGSDLSPENKFILEHWPDDIVNTPKVRYMFLDIETECEKGFPSAELAEERLNLLTIYTNFEQKFFTFGLKNDYKPSSNNVEYFYCDDEEELFDKFLKFLKQNRICIWSGWNSSGFDLPFIFNRCLRVMDRIDVAHYNKLLKLSKTDESSEFRDQLFEIEESFKEVKRLSPYEHASKKFRMRKDRFTKKMKSQMVYEIAGVTDYDFMLLDQQLRQSKRTSYKLNDVAYDELKENKIEYEGTLKEFYKNDWENFVNYNIQDVNLLVKLNEKLNYIQQAVALSYKCHCQFKDNFGTVQKVEAAIYNFLYKDKMIMQDKKIEEKKKDEDDDDEEHEKIPGGLVTQKEDLQRGKHYWVVDADVSSLYPSIIRGLNISPDTKIAEIIIKDKKHLWNTNDDEAIVLKLKDREEQFPAKKIKDIIKKKKYQLSGNNVIYENLDTKKGVLVKILDMWYSQRKIEQKKYLQKRDEALKLFTDASTNARGTEVKETINNKEITKLLTKEDYANYKELMRQSGIHYYSQWGAKILMNSCYGALAARSCRFFDLALAASVTVSGRIITKNNTEMMNEFLEKEIYEQEEFKNYSINNDISSCNSRLYFDTDSCFLSLNKVLNKLSIPTNDEARLPEVRKISKIILKKLEIFNEEFFPKQFNGKNTIFFEQELIAKSMIFCQPKKYLAYLIEEKGKAPKNPLLSKGLDIVRSSISIKFRDKIREAVIMLLKDVSNEELNKYILSVYSDFKTWNVNDIALPSSCNSLEQFSQCKHLAFLSGTPHHMKGAIAYNYCIQKFGLNQYEVLKERDKFKLLIIQPNTRYPIETFGYKDKLPKELGMEQFIDYDRHFMRGLIMPLKQIFSAINFKIPQFKQITQNVDGLFE